MWRRYGAGPRHALAVVVTLALAAYGWVRIVQATSSAAVSVVVWFALAILAHDVVLLPLYTALRRAASRLLGQRAAVPVAVAAAIAALLALACLPLVLGLGLYRYVTTLSIDPFAPRWASIAAGLLALAAVVGAVRR